MSELPLIKTKNIGTFANEKLLVPIGIDENENEVGYSYNQVLEMIRSEFPEAKTTKKCLQWYNSKLKSGTKKVPIRPRFDPKI